MRIPGVVLIAVMATGTAAAQQRGGSPGSDPGYTISTPNEIKNGAIQQGDVRDCRVRKRGEPPECRSRDGWRDVQREVDRLKPPADDIEAPR